MSVPSRSVAKLNGHLTNDLQRPVTTSREISDGRTDFAIELGIQWQSGMSAAENNGIAHSKRAFTNEVGRKSQHMRVGVSMTP
jgi:hypothetical protein